MRKLAQQQKEQRAKKLKNRTLKQTHDINLAKSLSPITKKLGEVNKSSQEVSEIMKKSQPSQNIKTILQNSQSQTPAIENIVGTQSLRDTLALMKRGKKNQIRRKANGDVLWNDVFIQPPGENRTSFKNHEFDITPDIEAFITNTKRSTKFLVDVENETVFEKLENVGFYENIPERGLKSTRMKDALFILLKEIAKIRNPPLPAIENVEDSSDLEKEGVKFIIPRNIIDIYTRLEVLLGLKLSGHTDTLTEASNLVVEIYKQGEIEN